jgi:Na+(H+)/acetate symporter ActP
MNYVMLEIDRSIQLFMGTILGSAVCPIALCITWKKANRMGCIVGALSGLAAGVIAWVSKYLPTRYIGIKTLSRSL